uniref:Uncharacterized protein n=4 Tax=Oryza TaxID=4527 RepID=A0A0D3HWV1_9ORYZ
MALSCPSIQISLLDSIMHIQISLLDSIMQKRIQVPVQLLGREGRGGAVWARTLTGRRGSSTASWWRFANRLTTAVLL